MNWGLILFFIITIVIRIIIINRILTSSRWKVLTPASIWPTTSERIETKGTVKEKNQNLQSSLSVSRHPLRLSCCSFGRFLMTLKIVPLVKFIHAKLSCLRLQQKNNKAIQNKQTRHRLSTLHLKQNRKSLTCS